MTIIEFLLARIADDEQAARYAIAERAAVNPGRYPDGPDFGFYASSDGGDAMVYVGAERVLAECAAKRRIVEEARDYSPELEYGDNGEWAFDVALRALAAVYADHPDYNPARRP